MTLGIGELIVPCWQTNNTNRRTVDLFAAIGTLNQVSRGCLG